MMKKKFAVCATLTEDVPNGINIMTDLRTVKAANKNEAMGIYIMEVSEQFKNHQIYIRPLVMEV